MFEKGKSGNPAGKPAGIPNKATALARDAIAAFVDGNAERLTGWLDKIAEDNPKDAFNAFMSVVEYHIPKLARIESKNETEITHKVQTMGLDDAIKAIEYFNLKKLQKSDKA